MISPERARAALAKARQTPDLFTEDEIDELIAAAEPRKSSATQPDFGEGGSILGTGPTGMDVLSEKIPSPEDDVLKLMQDPNIQRGMKVSPKFQIAGEEKDQEARRKTHDDTNTTSASQRRDLIRPAEHMAEPPPNTAYGGVNPLDMFGASIDRARSSLPAFAGGTVEHYLEPPVSQFRRDMAPTLLAQGIDPNSLGHESDEYKEYSDMRWAELYDSAKERGWSAVRVAFKKPKDLKEKLELGAADAIGKGAAAAVGADEAAFGGMGSRAAAGLMSATAGPPQMGGLYPEPTEEELDDPSIKYKHQLANYKRLAETNPGSKVVGNVLGAGSSIGMGGLASRAIGGTGIARGIARGAADAAGGVTSMAASEDRLPGLGDLGIGMGLGGLAGGVAGKFGKYLEQTTPIKAVRDAGMGDTEMLRGVRRTQRAADIQDTAFEKMGGPGREKDYLVGELEQPMVKGARDLAAMTKKDIGVPQQKFYDMTKDVRKPQTPLLKEAMKIHAGGSYETGGPLPVHGAQNAELQKIISQASHTEVVPAPGGQVTTKAGNPASFDLTPEEAAAQGIDVDRAMQSYTASGGAPGDYMIRVTPRDLNPEQTESIIALLREQIKEGKNAGMLDSLHRASREVRDQFPAMGPIDPNLRHDYQLGNGEVLPLKGWSAWQHNASQKTQTAKRVVATAGLGEKQTPERLGANDADSLFGRTSAYKTPGRRPDADSALEELAQLGGVEQGLKEVAGQAGLDEMKGGIHGLAKSPRSSIAQGMQTRLDPLLTFYGPGFGAVAPTISGTMSQKQDLPPGLTQDQYNRLLKAMGMRP